jgi:hypothetical protein
MRLMANVVVCPAGGGFRLWINDRYLWGLRVQLTLLFFLLTSFHFFFRLDSPYASMTTILIFGLFFAFVILDSIY